QSQLIGVSGLSNLKSENFLRDPSKVVPELFEISSSKFSILQSNNRTSRPPFRSLALSRCGRSSIIQTSSGETMPDVKTPNTKSQKSVVAESPVREVLEQDLTEN